MNRALPKIVATAFTLALVVLVVNAVLTYRDVRALHINARRIAHTREVVAELQRSLSILKDAETGQRGFLLTGDHEYLEPYHESNTALGKVLGRLSDLTVDRPRQQAQLERLRAVSAEKMKELACTLGMAEHNGRGMALETLLTHRGKRLMDGARAAVTTMEEEEQRLLAEGLLAYDRAVERTIASSVVTTGTAVALLLAVGALARHVVSVPAYREVDPPWRKRKPPAKVRAAAVRAPACETAGRTAFADTTVGVLALIAVAILALCAVLLVVSRF